MKKVLIANRGEIAVRINRTLKEMGIITVAVYSEADQYALHVAEANESCFIGPSPSSESYLRGDKIIESALRMGCDAIHPGYGFLSENASFARNVEQAGLIFIGPTPESIEIMGSKLAAKAAVEKYGIPMVPGTDKAIQDIEEAQKIAKEIGYPILIKASAGGGGKGMRIVERSSDFRDQMERAVSEAVSAFGDGSVFIEKYIAAPKHIEIQVLADQYGNVVSLFERDCSIQRRHQKVVEEAPSAFIDSEIRSKMGQAAVNVAKACNYRGAGTVEFLMDENKNFYFLEMNTRLQVEHPVTEWITGLDLVEQQVLVARGNRLSFEQKDLKISGHAIELRVCAENPFDNFLPSTGQLMECKLPEGNNIRVDNGYQKGDEVSVFYDPLLAKLICYGEDRKKAIEKMKKAIENYQIEGIDTTLAFGRFVMDHEEFKSGNYTTNFINKYFDKQSIHNYFSLASEAGAYLVAQMFTKEKSKVVPIRHPK